MRVIALIAAYNERRFIEPCLAHLHDQGIEAYLIDNGSTDNTVELAEPWLGRGLIDIESFPRGDGDRYVWRSLLRRKEELSRELDADWFIHLDPDEIRLPPSRGQTLGQALATVDGAGYNALNFNEFTFLPTQEAPDHDHGDFQLTLRTYYPFAPIFPHKLTAWKANPSAEIAWSGGHKVRFEGLRMYPESFPMKHYLFLSVPHAIEKYVERTYDPEEVRSGWHGWRATVTAGDITLPSLSELRVTHSDDDLNPDGARQTHYVDVTRSGGAPSPAGKPQQPPA